MLGHWEDGFERVIGKFGFEVLCVTLAGCPELRFSHPSNENENIPVLLFLPFDRRLIPSFLKFSFENVESS